MSPMTIGIISIFALLSFYGLIAILIIRLIFKRTVNPNLNSANFVLGIIVLGSITSFFVLDKQPTSYTYTIFILFIIASVSTYLNRKKQM
jgi:predicted signal transduction protein with EAL and GGDEF domain